ncbi:MAG: twin-arginine translocase subunit TatC [Chloroflexota bacterium]|nr:twin-arginine translocase subunit TatC [Chloroflexota bacterium]
MAETNQEFTLWQHLDELRKRLLYAVIGIVVGIVISFVISDYTLQLLAQPIGGFEQLQSIEVTENVGVFMRVTLLGGVIVSLPFTLVQIFLFVRPGLKPKERRWVLRALFLSFFLFLVGVVFAYAVMLPNAIPILVQFTGPQVLPNWKDYVNFVTNLIFWSGVCFEMPLIAFILAKFGIVSARQLLKGWRIALVVIAVAAAVITPTGDPINMALLMGPLLLLYALSILLASFARQEN